MLLVYIRRVDGSPFGVKWLGKAYFFTAFFGCILITRIFGLFTAGSASFEVLRYSLRAIALTFLSRSSSSVELSVLVTCVAVFYEDTKHLAWSTYLTSGAITATPT